MSRIILIAAISENGIIGRNGGIPWQIKEDLIHFKNKTMGCPCIMSRVTYESIPDKFKPLKGRENIVLTNNKDYKNDDVTIFHSFNESIKYCESKYDKIFITGGSSIYKLGLEIADTLELTKIYKFYKGDVYFPDRNFLQWELADFNRQFAFDSISNEHVRIEFYTYSRVHGSQFNVNYKL